MRPDRRRLESYLRFVNEEMQTAKLASEVWLRSAPGPVVVENDRFVRSLVRGGLAGDGAGGDTDVPDRTHADPAALRHHYWQRVTRAKPVAVAFGAADLDSLDDYFTVATDRSTRAALERARATISPGSPADLLLRTVDRLAAATGNSHSEACREAMRLLSAAWPELVERSRGRQGGTAPPADSVLAAFHDVVSAAHDGQLPPDPVPGRSPAYAQPRHARLTRIEAREMARLYALGRLCFTDEELRLAQELARNPRLQYAILAMHLRLVAESSAAVARLAADLGTTRALLPFTEAFVNRAGYRSTAIDLSPNPKLITVLCNNVLPAVAGELLSRNAGPDTLDAGVLAAGIQRAVRRGVFTVTIGLFQEEETGVRDAVSLSGFSRRVCPAATPFGTYCRRWLPFFFARCPDPPRSTPARSASGAAGDLSRTACPPCRAC